jgi:quercetin dioxygenase-like cupin family protein
MKRGGVEESMLVIEFDRDKAQPIELFDSVAASSLHLGYGKGEAHVYCIYLEPGAEIGVHRAGFGQLFLVVEGRAWAAGEDGRRESLSKGQGAYFEAGEEHSKGSEEGASVIMVQVEDLRAGRLEVIEYS